MFLQYCLHIGTPWPIGPMRKCDYQCLRLSYVCLSVSISSSENMYPSPRKASKLHTQQVPPEDLFPCIANFHLLLLTFWFFDLCLLLLVVSLDIYPVLFVLDLHMKYTVEVVHLCTYIVWFVIVW